MTANRHHARLRKLIEPGYIWFNGLPMNEYARNRYNYVQGRINAFMLESMPVPETLLNESHQIVAHHVAINLGKGARNE